MCVRKRQGDSVVDREEETEIETEFEEETMPETRLLDALALHKWSDLQQLYRPSL